MKKAVIFDFDGTIGDSFDYVYGFLKQEAGNTAVHSVKQKQVLRRMSMRRMALHLGVPIWKMAYVYFKGRRVMREHMEHVPIFPGMKAVVEQLHADGVQLFVVSSNSTRNIRNFLRQYGVADKFTAVRGGAGILGKRQIIRRLLLRYRLSKTNTWCVGDETGDVVAATAAGLQCIAVTWGFADPKHMELLQPTAVANHAADIPKILERTWNK